MSLADLERADFNVQAVNGARTVLTQDFGRVLRGLCDILGRFYIEDVELIRRGGGLARQTMRLRRALTEGGWQKRRIDIVRQTDAGSVALRIEWNNKDPFFDRDLESLRQLHSAGEISVGIIVTRGDSLQRNLTQFVEELAIDHGIRSFDGLRGFDVRPTVRQLRLVTVRGKGFPAAWAPKFVSDKFGPATTHWDRLQERIERGVGNPCPLLLLGVPAGSVRKVRLGRMNG